MTLWVEETERQRAVHGLDPQRQPAQFDGQWIEVHGIDAALHHVATQQRLEALLEAVVVRPAGDQFLAEEGVSGVCPAVVIANAEQANQGAFAVAFNAAVVLQ